MGDCDDTEILVTERAIQTTNTDDFGIQTSIEAISQPALQTSIEAITQLVDHSKTVIPMEEKNETAEEQQIIAGKVIGTNDLTTIIVIFIVILNYHRYYFIKIRMVRD